MVRAPLNFHGRIPVPEVAPLTYRDGVTHLELVYELSQYLKKILHPSLQSTVDQVVADAERLLSQANAQFVDGVQEFQRIHDAFMSDVNASLVALNDAAVTDLVDDETSLFGHSIRQLVRRENVAQVVVGEGREYATILEVFGDYPNGNVVIHLDDGIHQTKTLPKDGNLKNVTIQGNGREVAVVEVDGPFVETVPNQDMWTLQDFTLINTNPINTDNGIDVDYPRRWHIERLEISGFGGDTIFYRGGLNSVIRENLVTARDSARVNGNSGIRISRRRMSEPGSAATTHVSERNYIQASNKYGFLFEHHASGGTSISDIAEYCEVGFRFNMSPMTVISPYGEANTRQIEIKNLSPTFLGRIQRLDMHVDWGEVHVFDRRITHVTNTGIYTAGIYRGGGDDIGASRDQVPSIVWDTVAPHGRQTSPVGSVILSTAPVQRYHTPLWVKREGDGDHGWEAIGVVPVSTTEVSAAVNNVNTQGKFHGSRVFDIRTNRALYAHGPEPTDPWGDGDGNVVITPK